LVPPTNSVKLLDEELRLKLGGVIARAGVATMNPRMAVRTTLCQAESLDRNDSLNSINVDIAFFSPFFHWSEAF
jgi:hypothetical protein